MSPLLQSPENGDGAHPHRGEKRRMQFTGRLLHLEKVEDRKKMVRRTEEEQGGPHLIAICPKCQISSTYKGKKSYATQQKSAKGEGLKRGQGHLEDDEHGSNGQRREHKILLLQYFYAGETKNLRSWDARGAMFVESPLSHTI